MDFVDAVDTLRGVQTPKALGTWCDQALQLLLPHDMFLGVTGHLQEGTMQACHVVNHGFPASCIEALMPAGATFACPHLDQWMTRRAPLALQVGGASRANAGPPVFALDRASTVALHVVPEHGSTFASVFWWAGTRVTMSPERELLADLLGPHLHAALARLQRRAAFVGDTRRQRPLTTRQREVLAWLRLGKSNAEIALILRTSEANVKYHLQRLFQTLGVTNRTHAVAATERDGAFPGP